MTKKKIAAIACGGVLLAAAACLIIILCLRPDSDYERFLKLQSDCNRELTASGFSAFIPGSWDKDTELFSEDNHQTVVKDGVTCVSLTVLPISGEQLDALTAEHTNLDELADDIGFNRQRHHIGIQLDILNKDIILYRTSEFDFSGNEPQVANRGYAAFLPSKDGSRLAMLLVTLPADVKESFQGLGRIIAESLTEDSIDTPRKEREVMKVYRFLQAMEYDFIEDISFDERNDAIVVGFTDSSSKKRFEETARENGFDKGMFITVDIIAVDQ
ncbi:MAG: hypothetical protein IJ561_07565 [Ruminococcus sp.]|nr:hypothetical protein [Ruminococcus sp.]